LEKRFTVHLAAHCSLSTLAWPVRLTHRNARLDAGTLGELGDNGGNVETVFTKDDLLISMIFWMTNAIGTSIRVRQQQPLPVDPITTGSHSSRHHRDHLRHYESHPASTDQRAHTARIDVSTSCTSRAIAWRSFATWHSASRSRSASGRSHVDRLTTCRSASSRPW
jgi:hypothetical protein